MVLYFSILLLCIIFYFSNILYFLTFCKFWHLILCNFKLLTCQLSHVNCHTSPVTFHLSLVTCRLSHVTFQLSPVNCYLSLVTFHLFPVTCFNLLLFWNFLVNLWITRAICRGVFAPKNIWGWYFPAQIRHCPLTW